MNDFIENLEIILISFGKKIFQDGIGVVLDQMFTEKYLKSDPTMLHIAGWKPYLKRSLTL